MLGPKLDAATWKWVNSGVVPALSNVEISCPGRSTFAPLQTPDPSIWLSEGRNRHQRRSCTVSLRIIVNGSMHGTPTAKHASGILTRFLESGALRS